MENANYTTLTRQSGLIRELQAIANNVANISTTGYKREGVIFSEYIKKIGNEGSLSMARGNTRHLDLSSGTTIQTDGKLDLAIKGSGFFLISTPEGERLTRSGAFLTSQDNTITNNVGNTLLDDAGNPITLPDRLNNLSIDADGGIWADGLQIANLGLWEPTEPAAIRHVAGTQFTAETINLVEAPIVQQGYLEDSNVNPVSEIARMIEVQRSYELGQKFMDLEDQRQRNVISTLGR